MNKITNKKILVLAVLIYLLLLIPSIFISKQWLALSSLWLLLTYFVLKKKTFDIRKNFSILIMLAYPLFEFSIKAIYYLNIIPNSYDTLNRVEHFSWAFSFGVIAYFLLEKEFRNSQSRIFFFITFISIINFVGLANEIVEYFIRLSMGSSSAYVYQDTIKDLIMNIGGSLAAFLLITKLSKNSSLDRI